MKAAFTIIFQGIAFIAQYGNFATNIVPEKIKPYVFLAIGLAQTIQAWRAHYYNPDGSRATTPYNPN